MKSNQKFILLMLLFFLSILFTYIYFSFLPTIVADSVGYYSYMDILRGERSISAWNYLRGPVFPIILYIIFIIFGDNPIGFLFGTLFFGVLCILLIFRLFKLSSIVKKNESYIFVVISTLVLLVFNPLVIGFYHTMLTEFVACTFTVVTIYLSFKWVDLTVQKVWSALLFIVLLCILGITMWFLKQPYLFCVIIPMFLSFVLSIISRNNIATLFYKFLTIIVVLLSVSSAAKSWHYFLVNKGATSSVQSGNYISAVTKSGLTNFSVAPLDKQSLEYIESNRTLFNDEDLLEIEKLKQGISKYNQYEVVEWQKEGNMANSFIVFWKDSGSFLQSEPISYYLRIVKRFPFEVLHGYVDNYLTIANIYGCGNINWTNYYPIKEFKDWSCENRSIGLSAYETDLVAYDSDSTDWKSGNNDMSQYELINSPVSWVQTLMKLFAEPALLLFKILLLLSPFLFLYSLVSYIVFYKEDLEYRGFYKVMTLLFGYSFLYVLMHAVTGALIDRYAFVPYVMSIVGFIILLELCKRKVTPKLNVFLKNLLYRIQKGVYCKCINRNCNGEKEYTQDFLTKQLRMLRFFRGDTSFYNKINVDVEYLYDSCRSVQIKFLRHDKKRGRLYFIYKNRYNLVTDYSVGIIIQIFSLENYKFDWSLISENKKYIVFDLGMNKGFSSMWFAMNSRVQKVIGYEINPYLEGYIEENRKLNPKLFSKIIVNMFGLADKDKKQNFFALKNDDGVGTVDSSFFKDYWSENRKKKAIKMKLGVKNVSKEMTKYFKKYKGEDIGYFLKIDIEGAEYSIFERLAKDKLIEKFDIIMGETHHGFEKIKKYLEGCEILDLQECPGNLATFTVVKTSAISSPRRHIDLI